MAGTLSLVCAFLGDESTPLTLAVEHDWTVSELKQQLKAQHSSIIKRDVVAINVHLAVIASSWLEMPSSGSMVDHLTRCINETQGDGAAATTTVDQWLNKRRGQATTTIEEWLHDLPERRPGQVHIIVSQPMMAESVHSSIFRDHTGPNLIRRVLCFHPHKYFNLMRRDVTDREARQIATEARSANVADISKLSGRHENILLDGKMGAAGSTSASMYFAFSLEGRVQAVKVFQPQEDEIFYHELTANKQLLHPNIVSFAGEISLGGQRGILMPFFPRSVAHFLNVKKPVALLAIYHIAYGCIKALRHIHSHNLCYADVKPANVMLSGTEEDEVVTLVDFGSVTELNKKLEHGYAVDYALDVPATPSKRLDWVCLGAMLADLADCKPAQIKSAGELAAHVERMSHYSRDLISLVTCLLKASDAADAEGLEEQARRLVDSLANAAST